DGIYDKSLVAQTTIDFLDFRLGLISTELEAIESSAEQFKTKNRMVDQGGADVFLQSSAANERELVFENTQLELANFMIDELNSIDEGLLL
ncbi:hypothetical protein, partial [Staphylococcus aureus]|uniref:hypothetical protein n=1 Tax=Staphylococcus aureus TaxID=1280 RepID=UPI001CF4AFB5